jgi:hypothetical protein
MKSRNQKVGLLKAAIIPIGNGHHDWPIAAMTDQMTTTDAIWGFIARHTKP